ncbi:hypothetical protein ES815_12710 [Leclercia adecarboxylata]|uniref:Uncharacterized protein n=1 Tax=Leclercia adecarboxylata TaxID=83655 RepID=A0AAP9AJL3_9ENTR|nr:hypothetical protein [Leclercia adecarboxylata]QDK19119.1 hypothetical protein ES815_12710 [Leclercia adecarboxylata]
MHVSTAIKWLHRLTTILLLIIVAGYFSYEYFMKSRSDDRLVIKKEVTENVTLYVTQYGGGATVPDIYRYYLDDKNQTIAHLRKSEPFLVSDNGNAIISGYGNTVNVKLSGRIYSFSNLTMFYAQENLVIPVINLTALGVR